MPKTNYCKDEDVQKDKLLKALIVKNMDYHSVKPEELAVSVRVGRTSIYTKMRNPSKFTLKELRLVIKRLKFTEEEKNLIL